MENTKDINISIAKQTFLFHLKDIISTYSPNLLNEVTNFEKVLVTKKNMVVIRQTIQHFIKQLRKSLSNNEQKLKEILTCWLNKFKVEFPDDKEIIFMTLMYLHFQIEDSIDFLIECGKLSEKEKSQKTVELQGESMKKLSLLTGIKIIRDEYEAFYKSLKDSNTKSKENEKKKNVNESKTENVIEKETESITANNYKKVEPNTKVTKPLSIEEKMQLMEQKIEKIDKLENEMSLLKKEVETLKKETIILKKKCSKYEINRIIKRFFKYLCLKYNIPYTDNIVFLSQQLKENNILTEDKLNLIEYYFTNELSLLSSVFNQKEGTNDIQNDDEIQKFFASYQETFKNYGFYPEKSDLSNINNISH